MKFKTLQHSQHATLSPLAEGRELKFVLRALFYNLNKSPLAEGRELKLTVRRRASYCSGSPLAEGRELKSLIRPHNCLIIVVAPRGGA